MSEPKSTAPVVRDVEGRYNASTKQSVVDKGKKKYLRPFIYFDSICDALGTMLYPFSHTVHPIRDIHIYAIA